MNNLCVKTFYPKMIRNISVAKRSFIYWLIAVRETTHHGDTWGLTHVEKDVKEDLL